MIPNPIRKVLSSMKTNGVQTLLMGGQACVLYGAAEFSRDTDLAIAADPESLSRLQNALDELQAKRIAVPPFEADYLRRGHAIHFRCAHPEAAGLRVDVMSVMRGVEDFPVLWERRTTLESEGEIYELLSLPDLVRAKKTQRDKDWPMIRRLLEAHYFEFRDGASPPRIEFWLREMRTPQLLREIIARHAEAARQFQSERRVLAVAFQTEDDAALEKALRVEEEREREADRFYWQPLKSELESLRRRRRDNEPH